MRWGIGFFQDRELWEKAEDQVREFGADAPFRAAMQADRLLEEGDLDGVHNWCIIIRRTKVLLSRSYERVH